jgi:hypothetical protein
MPQFSRKTILAAIDTLEEMSHSEITRYALEHGLEDVVPERFVNKQGRATSLAKYLLKSPKRLDANGCNLTDVVVRERIASAITGCTCSYDGFDYEVFQRKYRALHRGLKRDGFTVRDGQLRSTLPEDVDLPQTDDEVHFLLREYNFDTALGHLDQAIDAHAQGSWASANAQLRTFVEELFDRMAERLATGAMRLPPAGYQRREWLANREPPFFFDELNEWKGNGTGFLEGFYRRLHPQGSHPGLSDEDDSTFRLHLVLLVARLLLKRL